MKQAKFFFLLILGLTACIIFLDWARNHYFPGQAVSPIGRIKTIIIIAGGIAIMKWSFSARGFKLFLALYLCLWLIYWVLNFMALHNIYSVQADKMLSFYKDVIPLSSPLPFIFFWFVDRIFFVEEKNKK